LRTGSGTTIAIGRTRFCEFQFAVSVRQFTAVLRALSYVVPGVIGTMEAFMHGTFERSRETRNNDINRRSGIGFLALPLIIAVAMVALTITQPAVSNWIAQAAQAEFAGGVILPDAAPTQMARPAGETPAVKTN
jgi:hypothetical protein